MNPYITPFKDQYLNLLTKTEANLLDLNRELDRKNQEMFVKSLGMCLGTDASTKGSLLSQRCTRNLSQEMALPAQKLEEIHFCALNRLTEKRSIQDCLQGQDFKAFGRTLIQTMKV